MTQRPTRTEKIRLRVRVVHHAVGFAAQLAEYVVGQRRVLLGDHGTDVVDHDRIGQRLDAGDGRLGRKAQRAIVARRYRRLKCTDASCHVGCAELLDQSQAFVAALNADIDVVDEFGIDDDRRRGTEAQHRRQLTAVIGTETLHEAVVRQEPGRLHVDERIAVELEVLDDDPGQLVDVDQRTRDRPLRLGRVHPIELRRVGPPDLLLIPDVRLGGIIAERGPETGQLGVARPQRFEDTGFQAELRGAHRVDRLVGRGAVCFEFLGRRRHVVDRNGLGRDRIGELGDRCELNRLRLLRRGHPPIVRGGRDAFTDEHRDDHHGQHEGDHQFQTKRDRSHVCTTPRWSARCRRNVPSQSWHRTQPVLA